MSYDITFIHKSDNQTWEQALEENEKRVMALDSFEVSSSSEAAPEVTSEWDRIVILLIQCHPGLSRLDSLGHFELVDEETGLVVNLFENEAGISIPYWHVGGTAEQVMEIVTQFARIIEDETGLQAYDPQRGSRFLDSKLAARQAGESLRTMSHKIHNEDFLGLLKLAKKPWWKFWER